MDDPRRSRNVDETVVAGVGGWSDCVLEEFMSAATMSNDVAETVTISKDCRKDIHANLNAQS